MMSRAKLNANRQNAKRSTGPRTVGGKSASARNALKHGLAAVRHPVLPDEDAAEFDALLRGLLLNLAPQGLLEELLVRRIAEAQWRIRRAEALEVGVLNIEGAAEDGSAMAFWRDSHPAKAQAVQLLVRYSGSAERSLFAALHELDHRQEQRRGGEHERIPLSETSTDGGPSDPTQAPG